MASVFLSPSTQEYNIATTGNSEEYYANLITDAMIPYLNASNISYGRNDPDGNVNTSIAMSNAGNYDLHVAIHSNAAPEHLSGMLRGSDVYYYRDSVRGKAAAEIFANNLKLVYPNPSDVTAVPNTTLAELRRTRATTVLLELAYHDNPQDTQWLVNNIEEIAKNLSLSIADYLGVEFVEP